MEEIKKILPRTEEFYKRLENKDNNALSEFNFGIVKYQSLSKLNPDEWLLNNACELRQFVFKLIALKKLVNIFFEDDVAVDFNASNYTRLEDAIFQKALEEMRSREDKDF